MSRIVRIETLLYLVAFTVAICGLVLAELSASATAADITGTWEVRIHYPPPTGDYPATYVLKQDGENVTGTYHGTFGPADVTGTVKSDDVILSVTVTNAIGSFTSRFSGKVSSAGKMSGTVTGTSDQPSEKWSAEKKK